MVLTEEHKKQLETEVVKVIIKALENHEIRVHHLYAVSKTILDKVDHIHTQDDVVDLLTDLANKWEIFQPILEKEKKKTA